MELSKPLVKNKKFALLLRTLLTNNIPQVDIDSLKKFPPQTIFIDAREENEYNISTIAGALKAGFNNFDNSLLTDIAKDSYIVVFCSVGVRSEKICRQLVQSGYNKVYNLYGGIFEWVNQGQPVVDEKGEVADKVHGYSPLWGIWVNRLKKVYDKNL